jgi:hypothetical protein
MDICSLAHDTAMSGIMGLADFQAAAGDISMNIYFIILLTLPLIIALLDNTTVAQPLKNIFNFYETQMLITMKNRSTIFWDVKSVRLLFLCG